MSGWIMGIVGVIALATLADILLPEGETAKYIKGFLAVFVVAAIVAPIPLFLSGEWDLEQVIRQNDIVADEELLDKLEEITGEQAAINGERYVIPENSANIYITENNIHHLAECLSAYEGKAEKFCGKVEDG